MTHVKPGETLLAPHAASGVGLAAVEIGSPEGQRRQTPRLSAAVGG
jgi:NADPH:quinone reductase-like Zn-dependent oxidoreductase